LFAHESVNSQSGLDNARDNDYPYPMLKSAPVRGSTRPGAGKPKDQAARFETPQLLAFDLLLRTASELDQQVARALKPAEVTPAQYNVLRILRNAGAGGLACSDVSERLVRHDPDVTRLLDRLEARGFVRRSRDAEDRRVVTARITTEGRVVLDKLGESIAALHARQFEHLSRDEFRMLVSLLETFGFERP
jgi:DNA-binding MarR family transcriptional regulator